MERIYDKIDQLSSSIETLRTKHVPYSGPSANVGGEIIRALDRLTYRFYNDGDMVDQGYGIETVNSSYRYLLNTLPQANELPDFDWVDEGSYEKALLAWWEAVTEYLNTSPEVFERDNQEDSREMCEEEREALRQWEQGEEDDEDWEEGW